MEEAVVESLAAEPPSYTSQSKPRGRKPKQGQAKKAGRKANGKKTKGAKSKASKGRKANKGAKANKGRKANKARKANKGRKATKEVEEDLSDWSADEPVFEDTGLGSSTDTKKVKGDKAKKANKGRKAKRDEPECEATGLGSSTDTKSTKPKKVIKAASKSKAKADKTAPASKAKADKTAPASKAKAAPARKRKTEAVPPAMPVVVPCVEDMEQFGHMSKADLKLHGFTAPPEWVGYRNVYSNSYRRSAAKGMSNDEVRTCAKLHSKVFTDHGLVHPILLSSFAPKANKDESVKPNDNETAETVDVD